MTARTQTLVLIAVVAFVAWVILDSTPKLARLYSAYSECGTLSGACPKPRAAIHIPAEPAKESDRERIDPDELARTKIFCGVLGGHPCPR